MELAESYRHCRRLAFGHYENFPVASWILGPARRDAVAAVYAFARQADDYSDEAPYAGDRVRLLKAWMARLDRPADGHPVFTALADARRRWGLPRQALADLVRAFLLDCRKSRYRDFDELLDYCRLSAEPVGRLLLRIYGAETPATLAASDDICAGLQLANHWQDLRSDAQDRDRVYLPGEDMARHGVAVEQLREGRWTPGLGLLMRLEVDRAEALFTSGQGLPGLLPRSLGLQVALTLAGGRRILSKIRAQGYDTLARRPRLDLADGPGLAWRAWAGWRS